MNIVKQSLYLCIGVLLLLLGLQGAQTLWQVTRLSQATDSIVAGATAASDARALWTLFLATEEQWRRATAFTDAASAAEQRKAFSDKAGALLAAAERGRGGADAALKAGAEAVARQVADWNTMAVAHLSADGVTELPSYHRLDAARAALETRITVMVADSEKIAAGAVALSRERVRAAMVWTLAELVLAVALGVALGWFALRSLRRQLGGDASEVAAIANAVADGDLSVPIRAEGVPADSVMAASARMQRALVEMVERVRGISSGLAGGADEIATGNLDLSTRTEQQAAALEKTAATMTQLGGTVARNADSAREANQLAEQASAIALRGGEVVGRAVTTMRGINDSSKKIGDIIGVIDTIAFQTNILALNAAVEAARAGEQGRGFAVVASEVRSLAQRSAVAAKEIKGLISASSERVEQGCALVDRAGATMREVVDAIQRVNGVVAQISTASGEQRADVERVGHAVHQMDQATQQNAARAEQSAAAAEGLKLQARQLVEAVAVFRLAATAGAAPAETQAPAGWDGSERRGPDRARNVVRPAFGAAQTMPAPRATGTDGARF